MQSNTLQTIGIFIRVFFIFLATCSTALIFNIFGKLTQERTNRILELMASRLVKVLRIKIKVHNPYNVDLLDRQYKYLIMSNHSSLTDIPISFVSLNSSLRMITKKELFKIPLFGQAMHAAHFPKIDRSNREQAIKTLAKAKQIMESGLIIWIAPEGTRSKDGRLGTLKKGGFHLAIESQAMIIPLAICGSRKILPKNTWKFFLDQEVDVYICKPVDASHYEMKKRGELMNLVEQELREHLD